MFEGGANQLQQPCLPIQYLSTDDNSIDGDDAEWSQSASEYGGAEQHSTVDDYNNADLDFSKSDDECDDTGNDDHDYYDNAEHDNSNNHDNDYYCDDYYDDADYYYEDDNYYYDDSTIAYVFSVDFVKLPLSPTLAPPSPSSEPFTTASTTTTPPPTVTQPAHPTSSFSETQVCSFSDNGDDSGDEWHLNEQYDLVEISGISTRGFGVRHGKLKPRCSICSAEHSDGYCLKKAFSQVTKCGRRKRLQATCTRGCKGAGGRRARHGVRGCPLEKFNLTDLLNDSAVGMQSTRDCIMQGSD